MTKYLEVTGSGAATQVPDRLDLHLSVTTVRPGVADALAQAGHQSQALAAVLREHGIADADLRTTSSSVHDEYAGPDNTRSGYRATQDLTVRVADLPRLSALLDAAVDTVGDDFRLNHLSWGIADESDLVSRARAAAFEDARAKAAELAALAGATLGELLRITETSGSAGPVPRFALAKADAGGFAPEQGTSQVDVSVITRWSLA